MLQIFPRRICIQGEIYSHLLGQGRRIQDCLKHRRGVTIKRAEADLGLPKLLLDDLALDGHAEGSLVEGRETEEIGTRVIKREKRGYTHRRRELEGRIQTEIVTC